MRRACLSLLLLAMASKAVVAQQYVLSSEPKTVISSETDPAAQFKTLLGVARFASGEIAMGTFDPLGMNLYSAGGVFVRKLARAGEGPGEMQMPMLFERRADSVVTFDMGLRRVTFYTRDGAKRQTLVRLPRMKGYVPAVVGVLPSGALVVIQVSITGRVKPDGPSRDLQPLMIVPADTAAAAIQVGEYGGYALVLYKPPGEAASSFRFDDLNSNTTWLTVGDQVAVGDPDRPDVLLFNSNGELARQIVLPVKPRPFDPKAVREARDRAAPAELGIQTGRSAVRAAQDTVHFEMIFDLSKRPKTAPYFRRLIRATDGGFWVELYREHLGLPAEYLRVNAAGKIAGRLSGPANVQFHEFGADYALGVRVDPDTDVQSIVLYSMKRK